MPSGPVDADGIDTSTCRFLDAKYIDEADKTQFRLNNPPPWIISKTVDEFIRYRSAIMSNTGIAGANLSGLEVRTNEQVGEDFFTVMLLQAGFIIGVDGFVKKKP